MNLTRTMEQLGELYVEKVNLPKDTFQVETSKKAVPAKGKGKKTFISSPSGPAEAEGLKEETIDPKTTKKNNFFEPKKFSQKNEKTETQNINNFMNKSIFDKLYEDVMSERLDDTEVNDAEALGLPGEGEGEGEGEMEGEDSVTLTIDRETAQKLHDLLMGVLGGEEEPAVDEEPEMNGEMGGGMSEDAEEVEDEDDTLGEATDIKELKGKGESLQSKNNKVGDVTGKLTSKGGGEGKVTDEVSSKSTGKHAIVSDTDSGNLKGKNNKVAGNASKVGAYLAGLK
jgi:hypothetical protein